MELVVVTSYKKYKGYGACGVYKLYKGYGACGVYTSKRMGAGGVYTSIYKKGIELLVITTFIKNQYGAGGKYRQYKGHGAGGDYNKYKGYGSGGVYNLYKGYRMELVVITAWAFGDYKNILDLTYNIIIVFTSFIRAATNKYTVKLNCFINYFYNGDLWRPGIGERAWWGKL